MEPRARQRRQVPDSDSDTYADEDQGPPGAPRNINEGTTPELPLPMGHRRRQQQRGGFNPTTLSTLTTPSTNQLVGFTKENSQCLQILLSHYPWIVYLGFSFWRKMLIPFYDREVCMDQSLPLNQRLALAGDLANGIELVLPARVYLHRERYSPVLVLELPESFAVFFDLCRRNSQKDCVAWIVDALRITAGPVPFSHKAVIPSFVALHSFLSVQKLGEHKDPNTRAETIKHLGLLCVSAGRHDSIRPDLEKIVHLFLSETEPSVLVKYAFFFGQFTRAKPQEMSTWFSTEKKSGALVCGLCSVFLASSEGESVKPAWALSYIGKTYIGSNGEVPSEIASAEIIRRCLALVASDVVDVVVPSLQLLTTLCNLGDSAANRVLQCADAFHSIPTLLRTVNVRVRIHVCRLISAVAGGSEKQREWLFDSGHLPLFVSAMSQEFVVRKPALELFSKVADKASPEQFAYLLEGCMFLEPFVSCIEFVEAQIALPVLESIELMLRNRGPNVVALLQESNLRLVQKLKEVRHSAHYGGSMKQPAVSCSNLASDIIELMGVEESSDEEEYEDYFHNSRAVL